MRLPRITVVTPSYNQARYLEAAIRSVLDQDYPDLEYIVLDGGSTDGSVDIIREYAARLSHWRSAKDAGQADALASGFQRATGEILGWLNSDDVLMPGALSRVAEEFQRQPEVGLVYGARLYLDELGRTIGSYAPPTVLSRLYFSLGQWVPQEAAFWRRSAYESCGGIDRSLYFCMDYSLFVRMWGVTRFRRIGATLSGMRLHDEAKTSRAAGIMEQENIRIRRAARLPQIGWRPLKRLLTRAVYAQAWLEQLAARASGQAQALPSEPLE